MDSVPEYDRVRAHLRVRFGAGTIVSNPKILREISGNLEMTCRCIDSCQNWRTDCHGIWATALFMGSEFLLSCDRQKHPSGVTE